MADPDIYQPVLDSKGNPMYYRSGDNYLGELPDIITIALTQSKN